MRTLSFLLLAVLALIGLRPVLHGETPAGQREALKRADGLFKAQHWAEARTAYDAASRTDPGGAADTTRRATEGAVACALKLTQWDDALRRAEEYLARRRDTLEEASALRWLAALYLALPHRGYVQGGRFDRGEAREQGTYKNVEDEDRWEAVTRLERARELLARLEAQAASGTDAIQAVGERQRIQREWIGTDFDLAGALVKEIGGLTSGDDADWWWGVRPPPEKGDDTGGDGVEAAERYRAREARSFNEPPAGIPRSADGTIRFPTVPAEYTAALSGGAKVRFLLAEVERLDTSAHDDAARALFDRAAIARALYGPQTAERWLAWWVYPNSRRAKRTRFPVPATKVWELGDDQALTPVGGRLEVVDLPDHESPLALLGAIVDLFPKSKLVPEARLARAGYWQSRQQFSRALAEYRELLQNFSESTQAEEARKQIQTIQRAEVALGETGVHLAGERPKLAFTARNAAAVAFSARRFDLVRYAEVPSGKDREPRLFGRLGGQGVFEEKDWQRFLAPEPPVTWQETLPAGQENRAAEGATLAPLDAPGAYVVEARVAGGKEPSRLLVVVTGTMLVRKMLTEPGPVYSELLLACDAHTGRPLPNRAVRVYESWWERDAGGNRSEGRLDRGTFVTDENGAVVYRRRHPGHSNDLAAVMVGEDGNLAFSSLAQAFDYNPDDSHAPTVTYKAFMVTDRPVYRPGTTVHFSLAVRLKEEGGKYRVPPAGPVPIEIRSPAGSGGGKMVLQLDAQGRASGEWTLGPTAALGEYWITAGDEDQSWQIANRSFRVEEYRAPEFEVNVRPSTAQARLGARFQATVEARYYFGAPVAGAKVSYKVYRDVFEPVYFSPGEYDFLYGKGYGLNYHAYPWLPWWAEWGGQIGWGGDDPSRPPGDYDGSPRLNIHELVAQGEADLDTEGRYTLEVDTARAKADGGPHDHRYTVEATVRGVSRRAVEGQGSVVATQQEFYAYVEADRGWYRSENEARLVVRALTPGNLPVAARGQVVISRVRYGGPNHDEPTEEEVRRWDAETGPDGRLAFPYALPGEGQYHVAFVTRDSWGQEVQGNAVFWVHGPKFDGRVYRFNELEIVADQRSYRVGETAHLLVTTAGDDARLLLADRTDGFALKRYRFLDLPGRTAVVDVPIDAACVPSLCVEATTVRGGRVHTGVCELIVPPEDKVLRLSVRPDKPVYGPGEKGTVHVEATDHEGKPAAGEVTLTAFNKALTLIQPESNEGALEHFYGSRYDHEVIYDSSFEERFSAFHEKIEQPQNEVEADGWSGETPGMDAPKTPLWRTIHELALSDTAPDERVVVTGSNIPTREMEPSPKYNAESSDALMSGGSDPKPPPGDARAAAAARGREVGGGKAEGGTAGNELVIRTRFDDTALWLPALALDAQGKADAEITFPQSLTTWRLHGYAVNAGTQVGDGTAEATTTRPLLVRLLAPRFFVERDEAVLSAVVNNAQAQAQDVAAELVLPAAQFQEIGGTAGGSASAPGADGTLHLRARGSVAPGGERRFDWRVKLLQPGLATVTATVRAGAGGDGAQMAFPVEVHGINKMLVQSGSLRVGEEGTRTLQVEVPAEVEPARTELEISLSPSLAGVMIDALPYLADYPYGCVEQTLSRFYPSVLVRDTLRRLGTDLETVGNQRRQMHPGELHSRFGEAPVYDTARLERMIREGLTRLYDAQNPRDNGWGWWPQDEVSSLFQTAYVLQGMQAAKAAGVAVDGTVYQNGFGHLRQTVEEELKQSKKKQKLGGEQEQAYLAYVLSLEPPSGDDAGVMGKWLDRLYARRGELNNQGRALLALALHHAGRAAPAQTVLRNLLQFVERDDAEETAWVRTPAEGWWFWWNNDVETNAWALKALAALDPHNDLAPRLVKWLLHHRQGGSYWRGTRDTAQVVSAMTDYLLASGEGNPDSTLTVSIDGRVVREVHITRENRFAFDDRVRLQGVQIPPGAHEVTIRKQGAGALYYTCRLAYFTREEGVKAAGNGIAVERSYFRLVPAAAGEKSSKQGEGGVSAEEAPLPGDPRRVPLRDGEEVASGEQIEVRLKITAKNTYDYLAFEDRKPAGCEPVEMRSGERWEDGFCANVELRDTKTVFFVPWLEQGEHFLRYRLRAETPGKFHALPTTGSALYAPEINANSDEMRLEVKD